MFKMVIAGGIIFLIFVAIIRSIDYIIWSFEAGWWSKPGGAGCGPFRQHRSTDFKKLAKG